MFALISLATIPLGIVVRFLTLRRVAWVLAGFAYLAATSPGVAHGAAGWVVRGGGLGHGVGMSQAGAYGYAQHGFNYRRILRRYYSHTRIGSIGSPTVRVLLAAGAGPVTFSGAGSACGRSLSEAGTYRAVRSGSSVQLQSSSGSTIASCGSAMHASGGASVNIGGYGTYRGALEVRLTSYGGLNVINAVGIEDYAKGVVANEMPASWPAAALRAQAVAVRSYALTGGVSGHGFSLYDDTRSQVYGGMASETPRTTRAVSSTAHEVVTYGGEIALAVYHLCSGGYTENDEVAWPGSPVLPYLRGVADPYDGVSQYHRWRKRFSAAEMQSRLGSLVKGTLERIVVLERGSSPRVVTARLVGSGGRTTVSGGTLQGRLGLGSSWMRFCRGSCPASGGAISKGRVTGKGSTGGVSPPPSYQPPASGGGVGAS